MYLTYEPIDAGEPPATEPMTPATRRLVANAVMCWALFVAVCFYLGQYFQAFVYADPMALLVLLLGGLLSWLAGAVAAVICMIACGSRGRIVGAVSLLALAATFWFWRYSPCTDGWMRFYPLEDQGLYEAALRSIDAGRLRPDSASYVRLPASLRALSMDGTAKMAPTRSGPRVLFHLRDIGEVKMCYVYEPGNATPYNAFMPDVVMSSVERHTHWRLATMQDWDAY